MSFDRYEDTREDRAGECLPRISDPRAGRLVVVSNRVAKPGPAQAGGLAQALSGLIQQRGGVWVGWSGRAAVVDQQVHSEHVGRIEYLTLDLPTAEFDPYYTQYANGALWPALHGRVDLVAEHAAARDAYWAINRRFADVLMKTLSATDTVWVQDYHLIPLGQLLRERGATCRIGFFLHTPMPGRDVWATLPDHVELLRAFASYDLVGVQTERDCAALLESLATVGGTSAIAGGGVVFSDARSVAVRAFPIGVDADALAILAERSMTRERVTALQANLQGRALLVGVDRLDYSKGLPERVAAFDRLLDEAPELRHRITYLQIAPESRSDVPEYRRLSRAVQRKVGRLNGRHGDESWTPLRYVNRTYALDDLAGYYRLARVGLVTPLRDGMNLVAKEFVACQDPTDPGVLVLSKFAGAVNELQAALIVNPMDTQQCASAMAQALSMPRAERVQRWQADMHALRAHSIHDWGREFLDALERPSAFGPAFPSDAFVHRMGTLVRRHRGLRESSPSRSRVAPGA